MSLTLSRIEERVYFDVPGTTSTPCECPMAPNVGRKLKNDRFPGAVWRHSGAELDLSLSLPPPSPAWSDSKELSRSPGKNRVRILTSQTTAAPFQNINTTRQRLTTHNITKNKRAATHVRHALRGSGEELGKRGH